MKRIALLIILTLTLTACAAPTPSATPAIGSPTIAASPITDIKPSPTPAPISVEINGQSYTQKAGHDFEAFDSSGKLAYVRGATINGVLVECLISNST